MGRMVPLALVIPSDGPSKVPELALVLLIAPVPFGVGPF